MKLILIIAALVLLAMPQLAYSGDLDNARAYWSVVRAQTGNDTLGSLGAAAAVDTYYTVYNQGPILAAVNSCIRKYAAHLGIYNQDTIRVIDRQFVYTLAAAYIEDATTAKPFECLGISQDGSEVFGLEQAKNLNQMSNAGMGPYPLYFRVLDDRLWINQPTNLSLLYFYGPIAGITFTDGLDTTNVLEQDRSSICDCATALVWDEIAPGEGKGNVWWDRFVAHILARGGTQPVRQQ